MLSPIIGAHTGPDIVALIHYGKKENSYIDYLWFVTTGNLVSMV